jgi:hypothetical protein
VIQGLRLRLPWPEVIAYGAVRLAACGFGALLAHAMFEIPLIQPSIHVRTGPAQWPAEAVATCALLLVDLR